LTIAELVCPKCGETNHPHRNIELERELAICKTCAHAAPVAHFQPQEK
jgi:formylmethanofuran dehydrogenase subunit E